MARSWGPLGLTIPAQSPAKEPALDPQPRKVEEWIASLPRAHVGETSRLVYTALNTFNRIEMPPDQRFAVLELFFEPLHYVVKSLRKHFIGSPFPLSQKSAKVAALVRELLNEYATGYKIVVEKILGGRSVSPDNRILVRSVYRAIEYLSILSLNCYQTYAPQGNGVWSEIHKLYGFSRSANTQHSGLSDLPHMFQQPDNIDDLYKQQLLLALVNPYQLSQDDIDAIYTCLAYWATYAVLSEPANINEPPGIFAVNLQSDAPPAYYAYFSGQQEDCLILDTTDLASHVRQLLRGDGNEFITVAVGNEARRLSNDTVKRMLLSWGALSKRGFKRRGTSSSTEVIIGLSAIHDLLRTMASKRARGGKPDALAAELSSTFTSQSVVSADGSGAYPEFWDFNGPSQTELRHDKSGAFHRVQKSQQLNASSADQSSGQIFNITNESAGGYCLLWKQKLSGNLRVGELLCLHEQNESFKNFTICVVRWMKHVGEMMVMGVEILSAGAEPVAVRLEKETAQRTTAFTRGLVLPAVEALNRPATLVTSTQFRSGDAVILKSVGSEYKAQLQSLSQLTATFKQFGFLKEAPKEPMEKTGFESIWNSI